MSKDINVRWGWLKFMYIYTLLGAGGFGLGLIVIPNVVKSVFGWPMVHWRCSASFGCKTVSDSTLRSRIQPRDRMLTLASGSLPTKWSATSLVIGGNSE